MTSTPWLPTPRTIAGRLFLAFLLLALLPALVLTMLMYRIGSEALASAAREHIRTIAAERSAEIERLAADRLMVASGLARMPDLLNLATRLREARAGLDSSAAIDEGTLSSFRAVAEAMEFKDLLIIAPDGDILFRTHSADRELQSLHTRTGAQSPLAVSFRNARTLLQPEISTFERTSPRAEPAAHVVSPILDAQGRLAGVLALQLKYEPILSVFQNYRGLGRTGEIEVGALADNARTLARIAPSRLARSSVSPGASPAHEDLGVLLRRAAEGTRGDAESIDDRGKRVITSWSYLPSFRWGMLVKQDRDEAFAQIDRQQWLMGILLGITALAALLLAPRFASILTRPIRDAARIAEQVSLGKLDTQVAAHDSVREIDQLFNALRRMTGQLSGLMAKIRSCSTILLHAAHQASDAARRQTEVIQEHQAATAQVAASVTEITSTQYHLLETMQSLSTRGAQTATEAVHSRDELGQLANTMRSFVDATRSIATRLENIHQRADAIDLAVVTITKVADQTNLLSINAAIEAEKAGAAGRGFLVVAREIRRLSDETAIAASDIEEIVQATRASVATGVVEMTRYEREVHKSVAEVDQIASRLLRIINDVSELNPKIAEVAEGMHFQVEGANEIRDAICHISDGITRSAEAVEEFRRVTDTLRQSAVGLEAHLEQFNDRSTPALALSPNDTQTHPQSS